MKSCSVPFLVGPLFQAKIPQNPFSFESIVPCFDRVIRPYVSPLSIQCFSPSEVSFRKFKVRTTTKFRFCGVETKAIEKFDINILHFLTNFLIVLKKFGVCLSRNELNFLIPSQPLQLVLQGQLTDIFRIQGCITTKITITSSAWQSQASLQKIMEFHNGFSWENLEETD